MTTTTRGFREPSYFVLASLLDGSRHGYGIIKQAAELSGGEVHLAPGTLYGALDRLAAAGLIEPNGQEVVAGRARHYYQLTDDGRTTLLAEAQRLAAASRAVLDRVVVDLVSDHPEPSSEDRPDALVEHRPEWPNGEPEPDTALPTGQIGHFGRPVAVLAEDTARQRAAADDRVSAAQPSSSSIFVLNGSAPHSR